MVSYGAAIAESIVSGVMVVFATGIMIASAGVVTATSTCSGAVLEK